MSAEGDPVVRRHPLVYRDVIEIAEYIAGAPTKPASTSASPSSTPTTTAWETSRWYMPTS